MVKKILTVWEGLPWRLEALKEDAQAWRLERLGLGGTLGKKYLTEGWRRHRRRQMMMN